MLNAILTGFSVFLAGLALLFLTRAYIQRKQDEIIDALRSYFEADGEKPSQFAAFVNILAETFATRIVTSAKMSLLGMQSVDSKNEKRLESDFIQDMASQQSPVLGMLLQSFPALGRRIAKNPALAEMAISMVQKYAGKMTAAGHNGHDVEAQPGSSNEITGLGIQ